jgi:hypothetical protein
MSEAPGESQNVDVYEHVVLKKFEGDEAPENEFERVVISNGEVVEHLKVEGGEVVGPVDESVSLVGKDVGRLIPTDNDKEVD